MYNEDYTSTGKLHNSSIEIKHEIMTVQSIYRLQVAQNTLARVVCQAPCSAMQRHRISTPASLAACASPNPVQDSSHHLPDPDDADTDLPSLIHPYTPSRTLRSSDQLLLTAPRVTLTFSAIAFSVNALAVWNSLSLDCRSASSLSIFKRRLKSELFTSAYGPTQPV